MDVSQKYLAIRAAYFPEQRARPEASFKLNLGTWDSSVHSYVA
jgi:hypothetical protein